MVVHEQLTLCCEQGKHSFIFSKSSGVSKRQQQLHFDGGELHDCVCDLLRQAAQVARDIQNITQTIMVIAKAPWCFHDLTHNGFVGLCDFL
jgi:hypothetical protein